MKMIAVANPNDGVGNRTAIYNLECAEALEGKELVMIDLETQELLAVSTKLSQKEESLKLHSIVQTIAIGTVNDKPEKRKKRPGTKDYRFSVTTSKALYDDFTDINYSLGMSSNSVLNMLMTEYVREKRYIIEDE